MSYPRAVASSDSSLSNPIPISPASQVGSLDRQMFVGDPSLVAEHSDEEHEPTEDNFDFDEMFDHGRPARRSTTSAASLEEEEEDVYHADWAERLSKAEREALERKSIGSFAVGIETGDDEDTPEAVLNKQDGKKVVEDFELLRMVGRGGFGKVFQVQEKASGRIFAMKVYRKNLVVKQNHERYARAERDILREVSQHPYIVTLHWTFQSRQKLYFVMDFLNGGQLFFHLRREHTLPESTVRFYLAQMVLALEHLHNLEIIHRDLKPENILLDHEGHVVLTDFGLAKESITTDASTRSFCGTDEYMAPEMIDRKLYGKAVDWWALGALAFDMLTGDAPFVADNSSLLYAKICKEKLRFPEFLTAEVRSLMKGLLTRDPSKRLGSGPTGSRNVRSHRFFRGTPWNKLRNREARPPFRPDVAHARDVSNFDESYTKMTPKDSPASFHPGSTDPFKGFSYVAPFTLNPDSDDDADGLGAEG